MRDDDKRSPLRRTVHTKSQWQTNIQERVRQDTREMRGKARRADKGDESGDCRNEKGSKCLNENRGDHERSPLKNCGAVGKEKIFTPQRAHSTVCLQYVP